ncbi:type VI secretion system lipoprotein TssJ [Roseibium suaedae]|uniref:Type VI secretion system protein VasD n=1 Tax=Roseibium suaedae TaxID=735517 RepID=A0A1M7P8T6_9HYPH|nr:type VI secretion system lipoprotein TssJ [Roseibium suaedae]SHN13189.1 type VI secretion system protein VasD [Roseibium suaedae]
MRLKSAAFALCSLVALAGCVSGGPAPTTVDLAISGAANMNGGAPAKVKVYYLASPATFQSSDFFSLFNNPEATLGTDLIAVDEFQLAPGRTVSDVRSVNGTPTAIGIVGAFRDIDRAKFKGVKRLVPNSDNRVRATLSGTTVSVR